MTILFYFFKKQGILDRIFLLKKTEIGNMAKIRPQKKKSLSLPGN